MQIEEAIYARGICYVNKELVTDLRIDGNEHDLEGLGSIGNLSFYALPKGSSAESAQLTASSIRTTDEPGILFGIEWVGINSAPTTRLWTLENGEVIESLIPYALGLGSYHRLVLQAQDLTWENSRVFRLQDCLIRFHTGAIGGNRFLPARTEMTDQGAAVNAETGPMVVEGTWVEVICRGGNPHEAKSNALALLGVLSMVFGPKLVGIQTFDEAIQSTLDTEMVHEISGVLKWTYTLDITTEAFAAGLAGAESVVKASRVSLNRALERYFAGLSSESSELRLIAFHSAIELIVRDFEKAHDGLPQTRQDVSKYGPRLSSFLSQLGDEHLKGKLMTSLSSSSIKASFNYYCDQQGIDREIRSLFPAVAKERNNLSHSGGARNIHQIVADAKRIVQTLVARELGINQGTFWNSYDDFQITAPMGSDSMGYGHSAMDYFGTPED